MLENERYFSILENLKKRHETDFVENINSRILIVDFLNSFIRAYSGSPALNNNGEHVGGITGFLYSIGLAIKTFQPTRCILVSDGKNSAARKRKIYSDYKKKRTVKINLNRYYDFKDEDEELQSMHNQMKMLLSYLESMPLQIITVDSTEADDVIAYLAKEVFYKNENKVIIMSSDKDFLQLIDERISIWSPTKKKLYTPNSVLDEYGVSVNNFLFYRTLDGDISDNISGVKGVGIKKIKKYLPILSESRDVTLEEVFEYIEKQNEGKNKKKFYDNILNSKDIIITNEKLMNLKNPNISEGNKAIIRHQLNKSIPQLNKVKLISMFIRDGLTNAFPDFNVWLNQTFIKLNSYATKNNDNEE